MTGKTEAIILAAGQGTRIAGRTGPDMNKCSLPLAGKALVEYPVRALGEIGVESPIIVIKHASMSVKTTLAEHNVRFAEQGDLKGTAKALEAGMALLSPDTSDVIVLYGDSSTFIDSQVLGQLLSHHHELNSAMTILSVQVSDPTGLGRILRDEHGVLTGIVEEKDASEVQRQITEINTGAAVYSAKLLHGLLGKIAINEKKGEYYLTDIVSLALANEYVIDAFVSPDSRVGIGINSETEHDQAELVMQAKLTE